MDGEAAILQELKNLEKRLRKNQTEASVAVLDAVDGIAAGIKAINDRISNVDERIDAIYHVVSGHTDSLGEIATALESVAPGRRASAG